LRVYFRDNIYVLYAEYYLPERNSCFVYDVKTKEKKEFIDIEDIPSPGGIAVDPVASLLLTRLR
jgi:hypothetical protein